MLQMLANGEIKPNAVCAVSSSGDLGVWSIPSKYTKPAQLCLFSKFVISVTFEVTVKCSALISNTCKLPLMCCC